MIKKESLYTGSTIIVNVNKRVFCDSCTGEFLTVQAVSNHTKLLSQQERESK